MPRRLVVVPNDPVHAYVEKGLGDLTGYFNPAGFFDEVHDLAWHEPRATELYGMTVEPTPPEAFARRVAELGADCIRAYDLPAARYAARERVPGVPLVVSVHDTDPRRFADGVPEADLYLAMSEAVRARLIEHGARAERISVMPNRVNTARFRPADASLDLSDLEARFPGAHRVLHVGRKTEQKNLEATLHALALLGESYTGIFIGRGDDAAYRALAESLGISGRCHWIESVSHDDLPRWYALADCLCVPSLWEGFGVVFIEAMACGTPVVSSDLAPMNEFIEDGRTGLLVPDPHDPGAIADRIALIVGSPPLRARLSAESVRAAARFDPSRVDREEAAHYARVIAEHRALHALKSVVVREKSPAVSIVLPTFNQLRWLPAAIRSVQDQTLADWELVVVNDGSTDGSAAWLDGIDDPRVRVIHQENRRLPAALNRGFAAARGRHFTWTSSDNLLAPTMLERLSGILDARPEVGFAASHFAWIDEAGRFLRETREQDLRPRSLATLNPGLAAFMYRADLARSVGDYDPELEGAEDWDMWIRLAARAQTALVPETLYHYRTHGESMTARIPDRVRRASEIVHRRALGLFGVEDGLERLYPELGNLAPDDPRRAALQLDFAARLIASPFGDAPTAARALEAALATRAASAEAEVHELAQLLGRKLRGEASAADEARNHIRRPGRDLLLHGVGSRADATCSGVPR